MFGTTPDTVPAPVPYLRAAAERVEHWRRALRRPAATAAAGKAPSFSVGIAWQGNPGFPNDAARSVPLAAFAPLAAVEGVRLFALQRGPGAEQARRLADAVPLAELPEEFDAAHGAFVDTAAAIAPGGGIDLVVTSDTSLAHVAGAVGARVWVALPYAADWRWGLGREETPWYPTMRLFRQRARGDWAGVFARIAEALAAEAGRARRVESVAVPVSPGELLDRITILQIKSDRMPEGSGRAAVRAELADLLARRDAAGQGLPMSDAAAALARELRAVNEALWDIEDGVRACEAAGDFGPRFVELARSVYRTNDRRCALKRAVNDLLGCGTSEVKWYGGTRLPT